MRVLVLDFDGVVSDSAREAFVVAMRTYLELRPTSLLRDADPARLYQQFLELMPLGNRAEDYGAALAAVEQQASLPSQAAYDAFRAGQDAAWLRGFHQRFYEVRAAFAADDAEGWRRLLRPYPRFLEILKRRAGQVVYAIATAKDARSVRVLLREYGIAQLFDDGFVLDKETGVSKVAHLEHLRTLLGLPFAEMTFVDDKVNHLDAVSPLGVRCVLAAWGYNETREHALARERGYLVCTLGDVERELFREPARSAPAAPRPPANRPEP